MGMLKFMTNIKECAERSKEESERKLLEEPNTTRAIVVEILTNYVHEYRADPYNPCKAPEHIDKYWTKPVVEYAVDDVPIRSAVGKLNEWTDYGKKSIYKVGSEVIVQYQPNDHSRCEIIRMCNK